MLYQDRQTHRRCADRDDAKHVPALDGIRGLAILLVMFTHFTILDGASTLDQLWKCLAEVGISGVDMFFVLSGFLITGILYDSKGRGGYFRNFYARRVLRIFPLYYAVVFAALVVMPALPHAVFDKARDPVDPWSYWLFLSNISMAYHGEFRHRFLDVTWSLAIEEQFYLIWPAVVLLLGRVALMRVCIVAVVLALVLRTLLVGMDVAWIAPRLLTPCRIDGLAIGALVALAVRGPRPVHVTSRIGYRVSLIALVLLCAVMTQGADYYKTRLGGALAPTLFALVYAGMLIAALVRPVSCPLQRTLCHPWLRMFGKYSYALYLLHVPAYVLIRDMFYGADRFHAIGGSQLPGQVFFYAMATALSLLLALASWYLLEQPFLRLKQYFPSSARRPMPATVFAPVEEFQAASVLRPIRAVPQNPPARSNDLRSPAGVSG